MLLVFLWSRLRYGHLYNSNLCGHPDFTFTIHRVFSLDYKCDNMFDNEKLFVYLVIIVLFCKIISNVMLAYPMWLRSILA